MGLDMYLSTNSKKVCKAANKASGTSETYFKYGDAIYWRKANAIHRWFVDHVQYGNDDCGVYEVTVEQLTELRDTCKKVLDASELVVGTVFGSMVIKDSSVAEELLPATDGFFFGSTEYDEYYYDSVERTMKGIDAILDNVEKYESGSDHFKWPAWREKGETDDWQVSFTYHASW